MTGNLTAKFGPEIVTLYSNSPLNRLGFLREDYEFLNSALISPHAVFIAFKNNNPLIEDHTETSGREAQRFKLFKYDEVRSIIGNPFAIPLAVQTANWNAAKDASGVNKNQLAFLGVDETVPGFSYNEYKGQPWFAFDADKRETASDALASSIDSFIDAIGDSADFLDTRFGVKLSKSSFAILAEARMILDWNNRVRFCGGCGSRNMSVHGGWKLTCPETSVKCPTRNTLTNLSFPRTDATIIVAVLSYDGTRVLVGRSKRFPKGMYSCLAGFLEPGESIEDCVRREVYEEAGIKVGRVYMYASQPWPYPANLMLGCVAQVADDSAASHQIHLGHDKELEDAVWVTREELRDILSAKRDATMFVPPTGAIAYTLLDAAANDRMGIEKL